MNKKVRDMKPSEMNAFYEALLPSKEREFANEFDNELIANSKKDREESESKILSKVVGKASKHFSTVSKLLEDNGVKKIYLPDLGSYDHNFSSNKERLIAEGRMKGKSPDVVRIATLIMTMMIMGMNKQKPLLRKGFS